MKSIKIVLMGFALTVLVLSGCRAVESTLTGLQAVDAGDALPPQVIDTLPGGGQPLALDGSIEVYFDQDMDSQASTSAWSLNASQGNTIPGEITWPDARTLRFTPTEPLQSGNTYRAGISTQASSAAGIAMSEDFTFSVTTVSELAITQVFPADGATEIENSAIITAVFNHPVVPLLIAEEQSDLPNPLQISPALSGKGEWINTSVFVFQPDEPLRSSTTYTVTIPTDLHDTAGMSLSQDYEWQFSTTAPSIGFLSLVDVVDNPDDYYINVPLDAKFSIEFRQPMNQPQTVGAFSLKDEAGTPIAAEIAWNKDSTLMSITPKGRLPLESSFNLELASTAQDRWGDNLSEGLVWHFSTYPNPAILNTEPQDGSSQEYYSSGITLYFASPMNLDSLKEKVIITPKPAGEIEWYYNEWDFSISYYGLDASTQYSMSILPGMSDIYGNTIADGMNLRFTTGPYSPYAYLEMPYGVSIVRYGSPQIFYARYTNVASVDFNLYQLNGYQFTSLASGKTSQWDYAPSSTSRVRAWSQANTSRLNTQNLTGFPLQDAAGEALPPGFYFLKMKYQSGNDTYDDSRLLIVADSNLTLKTTRSEALAWLTDLSSGKPMAGIPLTIYDKDFKPIGQGTTDQDGLLYLELVLQQEPFDGIFALTDGDQHLAFAADFWGSGVSPYDFGLWVDYFTQPEETVTYLYTDRPLYRPGQPVSFKGILRHNNDLSYSLSGIEDIEVRISNYQDVVYEQNLPISEFGSFADQFHLDSNAALGYYSIEVTDTQAKTVIGYSSFSVAEYRKPEFQVGVSATPQAALTGEEFTFNVQADFFSGGSVSGADVAWGVVASTYTFQPAGDLSRYSFSDHENDLGYYYYDDSPTSETIAEGQTQTDARGQAVIDLPASLSESGSSQQFTFEANLTDLAGTAVSNRTSVIVHQSSVYAGVRPQSYVGSTNEEQSFEIVAVDWDAELVAGQMVDVSIVERRWNSVQKQNPDGSIEWESSVEEIPVTSFDAIQTDDNGRTSVSFTPPNGGIFKAIVTTHDSTGNTARAAAYMWVTSGDYIAWRQSNDQRLDLITDKDEYTPGEQAEVLIASPFQGEAYALVTVERGHIRSQEVILLKSNSTLYKLPIRADMAPNVYLSVLIVKGAGEDGPPDFRFGMAEINVQTDQQNLTVEVTPDKEQAGAGDTVTYSVLTTDSAGKPVSAEVSLALTDLATLTLSPPNSTPILEYFYSPRALSVMTAMPLVYSIEQYNLDIQEQIASGQGMGSGGGGEKGFDVFGVMDVRQDFPDTAYWNAFVVTDENGQGSVTITLPDNLTTWRMDGRAVTLQTQVGDTIDDLVSSKPLLVRPQTPRFFVVGDQARLGAAVHNNTDADLSVDVSLEAQGATLVTPASQTVDIPAGQQAYVTWDVNIQQNAERVDLIFSAEGGGYQDASQSTMGTLAGNGIPVYRYLAPETVGTAGILSEAGSLTEAISLPSSLSSDTPSGSLNVVIESSLAAGMTAGLDFLEHYPYECIEQTISRFLPNVLTTQALKAAGRSNATLEANLNAQVNTALQRIYNWQNPDGGWGWWSGGDSDSLTSAYAVLGLTEAQRAGYSVSEFVLNSSLNYLHGQLKSVRNLEVNLTLNRQSFLLYVLARAGDAQVSRSGQLYDVRQSLSLYGKAYLAQTLFIIDSQDPHLDTLISDFANAAILSASGTHWEEGQDDYYNWNTDTRTTAIILGALTEIDPQNALNVNAVRWLMTHRTQGYWSTTQETAWALMALTSWINATGELNANYQFGVSLNGEQAGSGSFSTENLQENFKLPIDAANLLSDQINRLTIARDDGPGNLYYTAHLTLDLPVEDIHALDRGIVISRSYYYPDQRQTPVTQAAQGDLLLARLTIVVPAALHYAVMDDPLPAGLEAIDQNLETSPQALAPDLYEYGDMWRQGWGWWYFNHVELRDERLVLSADYLPAGTYVYTYLVRASTPGEYRVIPPTAQEFYFPDVYGRGEGSLFEVIP